MPERAAHGIGPMADAIRRHGEETYPHECCGALSAHGARDTAIVAAAEHDRGGSAAAVSGAAVRLPAGRAARRRARRRSCSASIIRIPIIPARPSQYDLDHAWPTFAYVIVAVAAGRAGDMTVWWLKDDRSSFEKGESSHGDENPDSDTAPAVHG